MDGVGWLKEQTNKIDEVFPVLKKWHRWGDTNIKKELKEQTNKIDEVGVVDAKVWSSIHLIQVAVGVVHMLVTSLGNIRSSWVIISSYFILICKAKRILIHYQKTGPPVLLYKYSWIFMNDYIPMLSSTSTSTTSLFANIHEYLWIIRPQYHLVQVLVL